MEPENRTSREMTYQDGWKKGRIASSAKQQGEKIASLKWGTSLAMKLEPVNQDVIWREAHSLGEGRWLIVCLWALPVVLFALFVWALSWLGRLT